MKHKIRYMIFDRDDRFTEAAVEKFCESVGFDNVIGIYPIIDSEVGGGVPGAMIHYKSEN